MKRISRAEALEQGLDYYFDQKKADHAVGFFENFLIHSKGKFAGEPFKLLDWQREEVIEEIFGWMKVETDTRKFRVGYIELPKKNGKALSVDTPIPTPSGWKRMGELLPGDLVFGSSGNEVRVSAATPVMLDRPCYEVKVKNSDPIVADASHQWVLDDSQVLTSEEISGFLAAGKRVALLAHRPVEYCVPCPSVPVRCIQVDADDGVFLAGKGHVPTHNSTLLSGISLYTAFADGEPSAECFGCATSRDQAGIVYKQMVELVRASKFLSARLEIIESRKTITCVPTNSFWRVISSDSSRAEGLNIHSLCYDELHSAKDRRLFDAIRYGGISRTQSLILSITTAGSDRASICYEQHEHAMKCMVDPHYDPQFFAYVRAAAPDDDYRSPSVWAAANPSFGVTMDEDSFQADVKEAESAKTKLSSFLRYRLNVWVQGEDKFLNLTQWQQCVGDVTDFSPKRVWYAGLDLAQTWDCNAFVAVSKGHDDVYDVICRFWIPGENAHKRDVKENVPWTQWSKDPATGVCLTPGDVVDYEFIRRDILQFCKDRTVRKIATDPHNSHYLSQQLQAEGITVVGFSQTPAAQNAPTKLLETLVSQGKLRTGNNPVLNWMAANATVRTNADGYIKVVKPSAHSPARVDGIVSLIMALAIASDAESAPAPVEPEILVL